MQLLNPLNPKSSIPQCTTHATTTAIERYLSSQIPQPNSLLHNLRSYCKKNNLSKPLVWKFWFVRSSFAVRSQLCEAQCATSAALLLLLTMMIDTSSRVWDKAWSDCNKILSQSNCSTRGEGPKQEFSSVLAAGSGGRIKGRECEHTCWHMLHS
jgi:hypothetical protein